MRTSALSAGKFDERTIALNYKTLTKTVTSRTGDAESQSVTRAFQIDVWPDMGKNPLARGIVGLCSVVWILTLLYPSLMTVGALSWAGVQAGYWWEFVTHMFLHGGFIHLLFNMLALTIFAGMVERRMTRLSWFAIFMAAGLVGGMTQLIVHAQAHEALVGASGGIMGIWGALIACAVRLRRLPRSSYNLGQEIALRELLIWLAVQMVLDHSVAMIAAYAHLGGLITGFAIAMFLPIKGTLAVSASSPGVAAVAHWAGAGRRVNGATILQRFTKVIVVLEPTFDDAKDFLAIEQPHLDWLSRPHVDYHVVAGTAPQSDSQAWSDRTLVADASFLLGIGTPRDAQRAEQSPPSGAAADSPRDSADKPGDNTSSEPPAAGASLEPQPPESDAGETGEGDAPSAVPEPVAEVEAVTDVQTKELQFERRSTSAVEAAVLDASPAPRDGEHHS